MDRGRRPPRGGAREGEGLLSRAPLAFATEENYHHGYNRRDRQAAYQHEVLAFSLGDEEYALDILRIREIIKVRPITELPRAPSFILGIISVRGQVLPVMDLRLRLRLPARPPTPAARILIATRDGEHQGLLVDQVRQVVRMRDEEVEPPPPMLVGGDGGECIGGVGRPAPGIMLILLALDAVLSYGIEARR